MTANKNINKHDNIINKSTRMTSSGTSEKHNTASKKIISLTLSLVLCLAMMPAAIYADSIPQNEVTQYSGSTVNMPVYEASINSAETPTASAISDAIGTSTEYHSQWDIVNFISSHPMDYDNSTKFKADTDLNSEYLKSLNMINNIRYIAGIPYDVALSSKYNNYAQLAIDTCVQRGEISHDFGNYTNECNLAKISTPNCSIRWSILDGYMDDSDDLNRSELGHRRWILNPSMAATGFGYASTDNTTYMSMYVFDFAHSSSCSGVMWPARNMPISFFTQNSPWSYSYGEILENDKTGIDIRVDMTDNNNPEKQWHLSSGNQADGYFAINNKYFGQPGCIIWEPKNMPKYADGDSYHVTITNTVNNYIIADYDVNFFDSDNYLNPAAFQFIRLTLDSEEGCPALEWFRCLDADYYEIYRQAYGSSNWKCIETNFKPITNYSTVIEYLDPNVSQGIKYVYKITAVKEVNGKRYVRSADSETDNIVSKSERAISTKLGKVTISSAKAYSKKKNQLKWKSVSKASGYKIYRRLYGKTNWTLVKTITKGSTLSWKDTTAKSGKKYQYRIRAYRKNFGNYVYGSYSSIKTVKTK